MKTCNHCGGLVATENGELIAGTICECGRSRPMHVGSYDERGEFIPDGLEEFIATLGTLNYDQLGTVAASCVHRMQEIGRQNSQAQDSAQR